MVGNYCNWLGFCGYNDFLRVCNFWVIRVQIMLKLHQSGERKAEILRKITRQTCFWLSGLKTRSSLDLEHDRAPIVSRPSTPPCGSFVMHDTSFQTRTLDSFVFDPLHVSCLTPFCVWSLICAPVHSAIRPICSVDLYLMVE